MAVPAEWDTDGVQHDDEDLRKAEVCTSWAGTPAFLAPEVASGQDSFDGAPVDVWALGVSLWHMMIDGMPFWADSEYEMYVAISEQPVVVPEGAPFSAAARELLIGSGGDGSGGVLSKASAQRLTIAQIRESAFVTSDGAEPLAASVHVARFQPTEKQIRGAVTRLGMVQLTHVISSAHHLAHHAHEQV